MEIFGLIVFIILACWIIYLKIKYPISKIEEDFKNDFLKRGYHYIKSFSLNYIGGIKDISASNKVLFDATEEGLLISYFDNNCSNEKLIKWNDIKNVSFQTEQSIKEQVSLGKLFVFGILAFGMKGKEKKCYY